MKSIKTKSKSFASHVKKFKGSKNTTSPTKAGKSRSFPVESSEQFDLGQSIESMDSQGSANSQNRRRGRSLGPQMGPHSNLGGRGNPHPYNDKSSTTSKGRGRRSYSQNASSNQMNTSDENSNQQAMQPNAFAIEDTTSSSREVAAPQRRRSSLEMEEFLTLQSPRSPDQWQHLVQTVGHHHRHHHTRHDDSTHQTNTQDSSPEATSGNTYLDNNKPDQERRLSDLSTDDYRCYQTRTGFGFDLAIAMADLGVSVSGVQCHLLFGVDEMTMAKSSHNEEGSELVMAEAQQLEAWEKEDGSSTAKPQEEPQEEKVDQIKDKKAHEHREKIHPNNADDISDKSSVGSKSSRASFLRALSSISRERGNDEMSASSRHSGSSDGHHSCRRKSSSVQSDHSRGRKSSSVPPGYKSESTGINFQASIGIANRANEMQTKNSSIGGLFDITSKSDHGGLLRASIQDGDNIFGRDELYEDFPSRMSFDDDVMDRRRRQSSFHRMSWMEDEVNARKPWLTEPSDTSASLETTKREGKSERQVEMDHEASATSFGSTATEYQGEGGEGNMETPTGVLDNTIMENSIRRINDSGGCPLTQWAQYEADLQHHIEMDHSDATPTPCISSTIEYREEEAKGEIDTGHGHIPDVGEGVGDESSLENSNHRISDNWDYPLDQWAKYEDEIDHLEERSQLAASLEGVDSVDKLLLWTMSELDFVESLTQGESVDEQNDIDMEEREDFDSAMENCEEGEVFSSTENGNSKSLGGVISPSPSFSSSSSGDNESNHGCCDDDSTTSSPSPGSHNLISTAITPPATNKVPSADSVPALANESNHSSGDDDSTTSTSGSRNLTSTATTLPATNEVHSGDPAHSSSSDNSTTLTTGSHDLTSMTTTPLATNKVHSADSVPALASESNHSSSDDKSTASSTESHNLTSTATTLPATNEAHSGNPASASALFGKLLAECRELVDAVDKNEHTNDWDSEDERNDEVDVDNATLSSCVLETIATNRESPMMLSASRFGLPEKETISIYEDEDSNSTSYEDEGVSVTSVIARTNVPSSTTSSSDESIAMSSISNVSSGPPNFYKYCTDTNAPRSLSNSRPIRREALSTKIVNPSPNSNNITAGWGAIVKSVVDEFLVTLKEETHS